MTNILDAIYNIVKDKNFKIKQIYWGRNSVNGMGAALEEYVKDAFAGTIGVTDEMSRIKAFNQKFSWTGSQNAPPDIMIKGSDAIEVKKTQAANSKLALNSSYPKTDLRSSSPMITKECREKEDWTVKDLIYSVGHTTDTTLKSLWMVYGSCYAAKHETYQKIKTIISDSIELAPDISFSESKEFGRVNQVDPLGITNLRIRGMWEIVNPRKAFHYIHKPTKKEFELVCIIPIAKYDSFPIESKNKLNSISEQGFSQEDKQIKNPNDPVDLMDCKVIKFCM
jgi:hypothetical protein